MQEIRAVCGSLGPCNGIYIWTHIPSGQKYVGQAVNLPVRLRAYYSVAFMARSPNLIYKLILDKGDMSEFSLKVIFCTSQQQ